METSTSPKTGQDTVKEGFAKLGIYPTGRHKEYSLRLTKNVDGFYTMVVTINKQKVVAIIDTGLGVSMIDAELERALKLQDVAEEDNIFFRRGGETGYGTEATKSAVVYIGEVGVNVNFAVTEKLVHGLVLGLNFLRQIQASVDLKEEKLIFRHE